MFARVIQIFRDGALVPKWQQFEMTAFEGQLAIDSWKNDELCRFMRRTRLVDRQSDDVLPPLLDSSVIYYRDNIMRITGMQEANSLPIRFVAQTWHIEIVAVFYCTGEAMRHANQQGKPPYFDPLDARLPPHKRGKTRI